MFLQNRKNTRVIVFNLMSVHKQTMIHFYALTRIVFVICLLQVEVHDGWVLLFMNSLNMTSRENNSLK